MSSWLTEDDSKRWIDASHSLFKVFEGRYDAYPLSRKWVQEWFDSGQFKVGAEDAARLSKLVDNFDCAAFGISGEDMKRKINEEFETIKNCLATEGDRHVGYAVAPYLFTWNFRRFKEYLKKTHFSAEHYFRELGEFLEAEKDNLKNFNNKRLLDDEIAEETVRDLFSGISEKLKELGINQNEPVGTAKLLHILAPHYFPLIDNAISTTTGLTRPQEGITLNHYLRWMKSLKAWLGDYERIEEIEKELGSSILKLVDEGLYMMSSINLRSRVKKLGLKIGVV